MKKLLAFVIFVCSLSFSSVAHATCSTYSYIGIYDGGAWVNFNDNTRAQQLISSGQASNILSIDENGNGFLFTTDTYFACTKPVLTVQSSGSRGLFIPGRYNHLGTQSIRSKSLDLANKLNSWMDSNPVVVPITTTTTTIISPTTTTVQPTTTTSTTTTIPPTTTTTTIPTSTTISTSTSTTILSVTTSTTLTTISSATTSTTLTILPKLPEDPKSVVTTAINPSKIQPIPSSSTYPVNPSLTTTTTVQQISDYLWNGATFGDSSADWKANNILLRDVNSYYSFKMCIERSINCSSSTLAGMSVAKFEPTMQSGGSTGVSINTLIELHNIHITNKNSNALYYSGFYGAYICNENDLFKLTSENARFMCQNFSVYMHASENNQTLKTDSSFRTCFNVSGITSSLYKNSPFTINSVQSYVLVIYVSDNEMYVSPNKFLLAPTKRVMQDYAFQRNIRYTQNNGQTRYSCSYWDYASEQNQLNIRNSRVHWKNDRSYNRSFNSSRSYRFDLDCRDVRRRIYVGSNDPYDLDRDGDGYGCDRWGD